MLIVGSVIGHYFWPLGPKDEEPKAKYKLVFGDGTYRVKIKPASLSQFDSAIDKDHARWRREVSITDVSGTPAKLLDFGDGDPNAVTVSRAEITQRNKSDGLPCTMHVTQKVGLNRQDQVKAILSMLDTDYPP